MNYKLIILSTIIILLADSIYLSTIKNLFLEMILKIQKKPLSVNIFYAVIILGHGTCVINLNFFLINFLSFLNISFLKFQAPRNA